MQIRNAVVSVVALFLSVAQVQAENTNGLIQTDRYSAVEAEPTVSQISPLQTIVTIKYPRQINTVGQAITYTLKRSGYRLASQQAQDPMMAILMHLPLPAVHRYLGPMTVKQVLNVLSGEVFVLVIDPVHRYVSFDVIPHYRSLAKG